MRQFERAAGAVAGYPRVHFRRIRRCDGCADSILRGRAADGEKMPTTKDSIWAGRTAVMPNLKRGREKKYCIRDMGRRRSSGDASLIPLPTGNVGVLTLFGRVTGDEPLTEELIWSIH